MNPEKPTTRLEASAPDASAHLSEEEKTALEKSEEAQHATGKQRENLTETAKDKNDQSSG